MANFFDYFNGSKYYKKRNQYKKELFNNAKSVIEKYKLKVPLYDETFIRPLTDKETNLLKQDRNSLRGTIAKTDGFSERSSVLFYDESAIPLNYVQVTRIGLRNYTDILAEIKARSETHYAIDLIDPAVIAGIVATYIAGLALTATLLGAGIGAGMIAGATAGLIAAIAGAIAYIVNLGDKHALKVLKYEVMSVKTSASLASYSNYYMRHKKLQAGTDSILYSGYEIYANGQIYKAQTAGSESFKPTLAYNPTHKFAPLNNAQYNEALENIDERTQGRSHYELAGNDGFMDKIAPFPLEEIKGLDNDIEYKQNSLKQHNQRLIEGYSLLAQFVGSNDKYHSGEWIQAVYNEDYRGYKGVYYDYVESKDFINQLRTYNQALRFKGSFFSRANDERDFTKTSQKVEEIKINVTEPIIDDTPTDHIAVYEDCITSFFYEERQKKGDLEEWLELNGEFNKNNKQAWKQAENKMLESLNLEKYWQYILALKAIEDGDGGNWIEKAIQNGYLESIVHNYLIAKNEMLESTNYTQEQRERFEIGEIKFVWRYPNPNIIHDFFDLSSNYFSADRPTFLKITSSWSNSKMPHILVPYGIFSKRFCERYYVGYPFRKLASIEWYPNPIFQTTQYSKETQEKEQAQYFNPLLAKHGVYEPTSYKDITQKVLFEYMPKCKGFLAKEFMQASFKILCDRIYSLPI